MTTRQCNGSAAYAGRTRQVWDRLLAPFGGHPCDLYPGGWHRSSSVAVLGSSSSIAGLPPGPSVPPVVQMLRWLRNPLPTLEAAARRFGDVFTMRMPMNPPFVVFSDPEAVKDIFTGDPDHLRAGEAAFILESVLGEHSLLLLDGQKHLRERRLMLPPFHGERMRSYGEAMRDAALRSSATWPIGRPFPIHPEMQAITLEVILRTVFGLDDAEELARMRELLVRWSRLGTSRLGTSLLIAVPPAYAGKLADIAGATIDLGRWRMEVGRLAPWSALVRAKTAVDQLLNRAIAERRRAGGVRDDVLSMLLLARDEQGAPMTDGELHDEMLTLVIAGHETSATTLAWTVHHLLANPAAMARVQEELDTVVGAGPVSPDHVPRLEWLDAVIKETLRLTPIVPFVARKLAQPACIGGRELPAGVIALASIYLTHRRPDRWPDPDRFDPSRFIGRRIDPYSYYPFGGGTRRCLGMAFAGYEMKIVLATILSRVALRPVPGAEVKLVRRGLTFAPSGGMPVVASHR